MIEIYNENLQSNSNFNVNKSAVGVTYIIALNHLNVFETEKATRFIVEYLKELNELYE